MATEIVSQKKTRKSSMSLKPIETPRTGWPMVTGFGVHAWPYLTRAEKAKLINLIFTGVQRMCEEGGWEAVDEIDPDVLATYDNLVGEMIEAFVGTPRNLPEREN